LPRLSFFCSKTLKSESRFLQDYPVRHSHPPKYSPLAGGAALGGYYVEAGAELVAAGALEADGFERRRHRRPITTMP
jgi:hypothetical protein